MDIIRQASATIKKHRMLSKGDHVLIALSGGPDSTCLALVLRELSGELDLKLFAHYVDHGMRPLETPSEIEQCTALCKSLEIEFSHSKVDVEGLVKSQSMNTQEAARDLRYTALANAAMACGAKRIALGHTLDDQAETFFMRILRGAGPSGLASIPPVRRALIRPLINTRKADVLAYLKTKKIEAVQDSSNLKEHYLRNRLRKELMPLLEEINPSIIETIGRTTEVLSDEERYFFIQVNKTLMRLITSKGDDHIELFLRPLETMDSAIARRVLRRAVEETASLRRIEHVHIDDILRLISEGTPGDSIDLPHDVKVIKKYSTFLITSAPPVCIDTRTMKEPGSIELTEAGAKITATVLTEAPALSKGTNKCVLDAAKATFPLIVRARRDGDYFYPQGFGKRKKLQDFFVDAKVPRYERDAVPVIMVGDDIAWIAGYRADERFALSRDTKRYLLLEVS